MKIEKLSDNQIRCTLTRADLDIRQLKISELAYGTEKAKSLFRDMMKQASTEFGFDTEDIPLMIEAIPSTAGSIVLIITKVDDPEELDTRFSNFDSSDDIEKKAHSLLEKLDGAEEFLDLLNAITDTHKVPLTPPDHDVEETTTDTSICVRLFSFASIDSVMAAASLLDNMYTGENTLYKDNAYDAYILALLQSEHSNLAFNRVCNMLSEYGSIEKATGITIAYLEEHCDTILSTDAIQQLNTM